MVSQQEFYKLVIGKVLEAFGVMPTELRLQENRIMILKRALSYAFRKYTSLSYKEIGQIINGMDHSTVMHNFQTAETERNRYCKIDVQIIDKLIRNEFARMGSVLDEEYVEIINGRNNN